MAEIDIDGVAHVVRVDHDMCMGNRVCQARAPQVFSVDDESNLSSAAEGALDASLADAVRDAIADCPEDAISMEPLG